MNMLEVNHLDVSFIQYTSGLKRRKIKIVNDLNLSCKQGEILAIFGASGSGKSLLAHAILGLLPKNAVVNGEIYYQGSIYDDSLRAKTLGSEIAFIPQTINSLNPLLKIKDQLFLYPDTYDQEKAYDLLDRFALDHDVLEKYPHECSGGMARRILVATAMAKDASFILADEPTPGMDDLALQETITFFKELKQQNKSALIISHDMETLLKVADRIGIFYDGTIVEVADRSAFDHPHTDLKHPYSKALFDALPEHGFVNPNQKDFSKEDCA